MGGTSFVGLIYCHSVIVDVDIVPLRLRMLLVPLVLLLLFLLLCFCYSLYPPLLIKRTEVLKNHSTVFPSSKVESWGAEKRWERQREPLSECGLVLAIVCIGMGAYAWVRKPRERKRERERRKVWDCCTSLHLLFIWFADSCLRHTRCLIKTLLLYKRRERWREKVRECVYEWVQEREREREEARE